MLYSEQGVQYRAECLIYRAVARYKINMPNDKKDSKLNIDPQEMLAAGLHFGHRVSLSHPKTKPFLYGVRNTVQIFNLEKSAESLKAALKFIQESIEAGKKVLLVGTKVQTKKLVEETAKICGLPWVSERWLGGTFTNFEVIKKRIDHLLSLERQKEQGELEKYTKKERIGIEKEIADLQKRLGGIKGLEKLPDVIFVCDMKKDRLAVKEAREKGVKVVGISDSDVDPDLADFPILANDDSISSVRYILDKVKETVLCVKPQI